MIRRVTTLVVAALFMMALALPAAFAASPSQQQCADQGGTFTKSGGQVNCEVTTVEEGKNPKFTEETQTTTTGQGNISNKQQQTATEECQQDGQTRDKCPSGQFK